MSENFTSDAKNYDAEGYRLITRSVKGYVNAGTAVPAIGIFDMAYNCKKNQYSDYGLAVLSYISDPEVIWFTTLTSEEILDIFEHETFILTDLDMVQGTQITTNVGKISNVVRSFPSSQNALNKQPLILNYNIPNFSIDFTYPILRGENIGQETNSIKFYSCYPTPTNSKDFNYGDLFDILHENLIVEF